MLQDMMQRISADAREDAWMPMNTPYMLNTFFTRVSVG